MGWPQARERDGRERGVRAPNGCHGGTRPPAAPEIVRFVETALARFPELTEESGSESPWASSPLSAEIVGDLIYFPMTFSGAEYARDVLAEIAASLGLVCYDPQIEGLLPNVDATPASEIGAKAPNVDATPASEIGAKAAAALGAYLDQRDAQPHRRNRLRRFFRSSD